MSLLYSIYGLRLQANIPIPWLETSPSLLPPDLQVWLNLIPSSVPAILNATQQIWYVSPNQDEHGEPALTVWKLAGGAYFRFLYRDGTEFIVDRQGTRVWAAWQEVTTLEDTLTYLLGPVLGFVLRLRGVTSLHASAIVAGDRTVALLGPAGAGKSTTAAAFAKLGYPVLSDDLVVLWEQDENLLVQPGYLHLRLWPESVHILQGSPDALPRLISTWDKCYLDLRSNGYQFQRQPLPLAAIYVLDDRCIEPTAPSVEDMPPKTGLIALVANTYVNYMLDKTMRAREFELLGRIIASVPLRLVKPHADPVFLSRLCDVILDDFQALTVSAPSS